MVPTSNMIDPWDSKFTSPSRHLEVTHKEFLFIIIRRAWDRETTRTQGNSFVFKESYTLMLAKWKKYKTM